MYKYVIRNDKWYEFMNSLLNVSVNSFLRKKYYFLRFIYLFKKFEVCVFSYISEFPK